MRLSFCTATGSTAGAWAAAAELRPRLATPSAQQAAALEQNVLLFISLLLLDGAVCVTTTRSGLGL